MYSVALSVVVLTASLLKTVLAIDCYVCSSFDGGEEHCEDEFLRNVHTEPYINRECRYEYFKANYCIKLKGTREDGSKILVRHCSDEDWGRHCGDIKWRVGAPEEKKYEKIYGCLETCHFDGCNRAQRRSLPYILIVTAVCLIGFHFAS